MESTISKNFVFRLIKNQVTKKNKNNKQKNGIYLNILINENIKGFINSALKQKSSEALFCRKLKPSLNVQETSIELKLFN